MVWFKKKKQLESNLDLGLGSDSDSADQLPDQSGAVPEETDRIPEWREDNDVCHCGRTELVYGSDVSVQLTTMPSWTILHRKWTRCEVFKEAASNG